MSHNNHLTLQPNRSRCRFSTGARPFGADIACWTLFPGQSLSPLFSMAKTNAAGVWQHEWNAWSIKKLTLRVARSKIEII